MSLTLPPSNNIEYNEVPTEEGDDDDDMEDDTVFVQDPTIHLKPLMHPKRRKKTVNQVTRRPRGCCGQRSRRSTFLTCVFVLVLVALTAFLMIYIYRNTLSSFVKTFKEAVKLKPMDAKKEQLSLGGGCDDIVVENVWSKTLPFLMSESASRLIHVNGDDVLDVVLGFGTGVDSLITSRLKCEIYFDGIYPCFGGLVALDGRTGRELWRQYDIHEVFAVNCDLDLNGDGFQDCIGAGRGASFSAVNGRNGSLLWRYRSAHAGMNFYTPQGIPDVDQDGVADLVQVHGGDPVFKPEERRRPVGEIIIVSGRTGRLIFSQRVPDLFESYYSPQLLSLGPDGGHTAILLGTGGETHGGSLYLISLRDLIEQLLPDSSIGYDSISVSRLYSDHFKGIMTPPVLADITGDGLEDIIISMFNSTVVAFDGRAPYKVLWKFSMPHSAESYNTPAIGFYNNDSVPDFAIQYSVGPGYPIYYYSQVLILDGRDGKVLARPSQSNTGIQASPLTVSFKEKGSDLFLFWSQTCRGHEKEMSQHSFAASYTQAEQSRAHLCKVKYNTTTVTRFIVNGRQHPQAVLYNSEAAFHGEHDGAPNVTRKALQFVRSHPEFAAEFQRYVQNLRGRPAARRRKRHVGPHDNEGLQRAISTGCLAPSLEPPKGHDSHIDVIFSTYWSEPSEAVLSTPQEDECMREWMKVEKQRFDRTNPFFGMDHDHYQMSVKKHCHKRYGRLDVNEGDYNEFDIHVGQLTVYRRRLKCVCKTGHCPHILPLKRQGWAAYMGTFGNSHWNRKTMAPT